MDLPPYSNYSGNPISICLWKDQEAAIFDYGGGYRQRCSFWYGSYLYILFHWNADFNLDGKQDDPTIMYYGFDWISGEYFYAVTFLVCSLLGLCIGSSLTTAATIGVAFIGMASAMDFSLMHHSRCNHFRCISWG